ncbi:DMT family transporter [Pseudomonas phenolilytica]|jgi:transporter family-2 protein|uniref:DMT family transporter n=1 Tax=Pseudomonas phenolilytica TaxID=2746321 RepID=UPI001F3FA96A|nr:DMT family transporter [Pseudomonas phenolilytica]MDT3708994.1 DMT family transporter [Pseudomonadaceae bacterium]UIP86902.1 DMT family transporter [Pseudomonas phenolilytica]
MPMLAWWLLALPLIAGALLPLQAGMNGEVARQLSSVMNAALVSFAVGTLALLCIVLVQRDPPTLQGLRGITWWHWSSGLLGVFLIATAAYAAPRVGASLFMALLLAGQLLMALLLDQFGWAGYRQAPISLRKVGGMLLVFTGVWLIRRG